MESDRQMSMDLFERALPRRHRKPAPVGQRLSKAVGTLTFSMWLGWGGAGLALASGFFAHELGMVEPGGHAREALLRSLPLVAVFAAVALYIKFALLNTFLRVAEMFPKAESQPMRMYWTPSKALVHKYVELLPGEDSAQDADEDAADGVSSGPVEPAEPVRAVVEKNLRRFDTSTRTIPVTVHLDPKDPELRVLIDDGRFLYAGNILAKDEQPPSFAKRAAGFTLFILFVLFLARLGMA